MRGRNNNINEAPLLYKLLPDKISRENYQLVRLNFTSKSISVQCMHAQDQWNKTSLLFRNAYNKFV